MFCIQVNIKTAGLNLCANVHWLQLLLAQHASHAYGNLRDSSLYVHLSLSLRMSYLAETISITHYYMYIVYTESINLRVYTHAYVRSFIRRQNVIFSKDRFMCMHKSLHSIDVTSFLELIVAWRELLLAQLSLARTTNLACNYSF